MIVYFHFSQPLVSKTLNNIPIWRKVKYCSISYPIASAFAFDFKIADKFCLQLLTSTMLCCCKLSSGVCLRGFIQLFFNLKSFICNWKHKFENTKLKTIAIGFIFYPLESLKKLFSLCLGKIIQIWNRTNIFF